VKIYTCEHCHETFYADGKCVDKCISVMTNKSCCHKFETPVTSNLILFPSVEAEKKGYIQ
jgi:hypothetical protein